MTHCRSTGEGDNYCAVLDKVSAITHALHPIEWILVASGKSGPINSNQRKGTTFETPAKPSASTDSCKYKRSLGGAEESPAILLR